MQCHKNFYGSWQRLRGRRRIQEERIGTAVGGLEDPVRFPSRDMYKLDNIFLDNVKLHINVPKFGRAGKTEVSFSDNDGEVPRSQPLPGKSSVPPSFDSNLEATFKIFNRAYVGMVENPGVTYNMQETFSMEDSFKVKVTSLGENLFRRWSSPEDVDPERVTWLRVYGIPCHAENFDLFAFITKTVGLYICDDDCMSSQTKFDVESILVRTGCSLAINEIFSIRIEVIIFRIKVVEEKHVAISIPQKATIIKSREDSDSKSLSGDLEGVGEESSWGFSEDEEIPIPFHPRWRT
ncbi:hypothetical protein KIW84_056397 [Lathyrus oleraceus]|uniref:DUF4283 domain-containing protein n=1 Tax=Pisum sativum TaxID=3888 RepID=A0A9D5ALC1_PEA|nr:hypothetical protein KIW84_056397 [Pisum sativum]